MSKSFISWLIACALENYSIKLFLFELVLVVHILCAAHCFCCNHRVFLQPQYTHHNLHLTVWVVSSWSYFWTNTSKDRHSFCLQATSIFANAPKYIYFYYKCLDWALSSPVIFSVWKGLRQGHVSKQWMFFSFHLRTRWPESGGYTCSLRVGR